MAPSCKSDVQVTSNGWLAEFISAAWRLWREEGPFQCSTDRIGLVTRGRHASFDSIWSNLKAWCRDADPELTMGRINATANHRRVFDSVREPGAQEGVLPSEGDTIGLIASLEIYPLDFQLEPSTSLDVITALASKAAGRAKEPTSEERAETVNACRNLLYFAMKKPENRSALRSLHVGASIHASMRWDKERKFKPNDYYDFQHATIALSYCDAFLTEVPLHVLVTRPQLDLEQVNACRVISDMSVAAEFSRSLLN